MKTKTDFFEWTLEICHIFVKFVLISRWFCVVVFPQNLHFYGESVTFKKNKVEFHNSSIAETAHPCKCWTKSHKTPKFDRLAMSRCALSGRWSVFCGTIISLQQLPDFIPTQILLRHLYRNVHRLFLCQTGLFTRLYMASCGSPIVTIITKKRVKIITWSPAGC